LSTCRNARLPISVDRLLNGAVRGDADRLHQRRAATGDTPAASATDRHR
jgi:hypothetical protein